MVPSTAFDALFAPLVLLQSVPFGIVFLYGFAFSLALVPLGIGGLSLYRWHVLSQDEANQYRATVDGPIEVAGTVQAADSDPIRASVSATECVVCEIEAQRYVSGQHGGDWRTVTSRAERHPFVIDSPLGTVRVEPEAADLVFEDEVVAEVEKGEEPTGRMAGFFEAVGVDASEGTLADLAPSNTLFGSKYRVVERRVDIGEDVYVAGTASRDADVTVGFDSPDAVIRALEDPSLTQRLFGLPFIIGDRGEQAVRGHFWRRGLLFTAGGAVALLLVAGILT